MSDTIPTGFTVPLVEYTRLAAENERLRARLAEAERLIGELQGHEGAEGWSDYLREDLTAFWAADQPSAPLRNERGEPVVGTCPTCEGLGVTAVKGTADE